MPTVEELGQKIRAKYPGAYDDLDDTQLGRSVKTKFPGAYDDFADIVAEPERPITTDGTGQGVKIPPFINGPPEQPGLLERVGNVVREGAKNLQGTLLETIVRSTPGIPKPAGPRVGQRPNSKPLVPIPELLPPAPDDSGLVHFTRAALKTIEPMTSMESLAMLGGLGAAGKVAGLARTAYGRTAARLFDVGIDAYFATQAGRGLLESAPRVRAAWEKKDYPALFTELGQDAVQGIFGTYFGIRGGKKGVELGKTAKAAYDWVKAGRPGEAATVPERPALTAGAPPSPTPSAPATPRAPIPETGALLDRARDIGARTGKVTSQGLRTGLGVGPRQADYLLQKLSEAGEIDPNTKKYLKFQEPAKPAKVRKVGKPKATPEVVTPQPAEAKPLVSPPQPPLPVAPAAEPPLTPEEMATEANYQTALQAERATKYEPPPKPAPDEFAQDLRPTQEEAATPAPAPAAAPATAKQPWEMTREEFSKEALFRGVGTHNATGPDTYWTNRQSLARTYAPYGDSRIKVGFKRDVDVKRYGAESVDSLIAENERLGAPGVHIEEGIPVVAEFPSDTPDIHRAIVEEALASGQPVPRSVLAEYPELKPKELETPQPRETEPAVPSPKPASSLAAPPAVEGKAPRKTAVRRREAGVPGEKPQVAPPEVQSKPEWVESFAQQFSKPGHGFGTTIQSARARVKKWTAEVKSGDTTRAKDLKFYQDAIARYEQLKTQPQPQRHPALSRKKGERGALILGKQKPSIIEQGEEYAASPGKFHAAIDFTRPLESRVAGEGKAGAELMGKLKTARDTGEVAAGKRIIELKDAGLLKLTREERLNLSEALQGEADPLNEKVQKVMDSVHQVSAEIAAEAKGLKVMVRERRTIKPGEELPPGFKPTRGQVERREAGQKVFISYKRPFEQRANYYPHLIPHSDALKAGPIRADVIENTERIGFAENPTDAANKIEDFRAWLDKGGRCKMLEKFMVESGQAANPAEAMALLTQFRKRHIGRQGSLEYSRQVDLPFYDPDPLRVLPPWVHSASLRLTHIRELGQNNETVNRLIKRIDDAGDNATFVRAGVDRILRNVEEPDNGLAKLSRAVRVFSGFKLGLSAIANSSQGALNSLLASDLPSMLAGGRAALTKEGWRFGERSGAALEGVINEMTRYAGAENHALGTFLKAVGFTPTERANRVWAATAGATYLKRMNRLLQRGPRATDRVSLSGGYGRAVKMTQELGIDPEALAKRGAPTGDEILMAAKRFSDTTQFRADAQDLPFFASTSTGKVFFQFKQYIYGQTRLLHREILQEFKEGRYGRGVRSLLVLAAVFPMAGEVIQDIRSLLTGRNRPGFGQPLARYMDSIGATGALGVLDSIMSSARYGRVAEWISGPTVGQAATVIEDAAKDVQNGKILSEPRKSLLLKEAFRNIPLAGPLLVNRVFPYTGVNLKGKPGESAGAFRNRVKRAEVLAKYRRDRKDRLEAARRR